MITIREGELNKIIIRSNDNLTGTGSVYLFELESIQSKEKFYFTPQNQSTNSRYMEFQVREITGTTYSIALTASVPNIELTYGGQYNYKVWQQDTYSLTASSCGIVLDYGKGLYINGEYEDFFFEIDDDIKNYIFIEYEPSVEFEFDDDITNKIFEELEKALTTEIDEDLICEDGLTILIW